MSGEVILHQNFYDEVVFLEPGSVYQYCGFYRCILVTYEGLGPKPTITQSVVDACSIMTFSTYLEQFNKPKEPAISPLGFFGVDKPLLAVPWYVGKGKRWL